MIISNKSSSIHQIDRVDYYLKEKEGTIKVSSYLGQTSQVSNNDFLEYGAKLLIEKNKYNDKFLPNLYNSKSQTLLGTSILDVEKKSPFIVPTLSHVDSSGFGKIEEDFLREYEIDRYFGTTFSEGIRFYLINVRKNISNVTLLNTSRSDEFINIEFDEIDLSFDKVLYVFLIDNINNDETVVKINLSHKAWVDDLNNPLRNLNDFYLRNDDLLSILNNQNPVKKIKNISDRIIDKSSGTLLGIGNKIELDNLPVLKNMLPKKTDDGKDILIWSNSTSYSFGDIVELGDSLWVSLSDNNKGNYPVISMHWELKEKLIDYYNNRLEIEFKENTLGIDNEGTISPGNIITYFDNKDGNKVNFQVDTIPGLNLVFIDDIDNNTKKYLEAYTYDGKIIQLERGINFDHKLSQDYENSITLKDTNDIKIKNIKKILLDVERFKYAVEFSVSKFDRNGNLISASDLDITNLSIDYENILDSSKNKKNIKLSLSDDMYSIEGEYNIKQIPEKELIDLEKREIIENPSKSFSSLESEFNTRDYIPESKIKDAEFTKNKVVDATEDIIYAYISDIITVSLKYSETFLDHVIDNNGNIIYPEDNQLKINVFPNSINEYSNYIKYEIVLTEASYNIKIIECDPIIIFDKYEQDTFGNCVFRFYVDDNTVNKENINISVNKGISPVITWEKVGSVDMGYLRFSNVRDNIEVTATYKN